MSMIGKTLGQFECTTLLGKGGMGIVYGAKNQRLCRKVAVHVLPEESAKGADYIYRFKRKAKRHASYSYINSPPHRLV